MKQIAHQQVRSARLTYANWPTRLKGRNRNSVSHTHTHTHTHTHISFWPLPPGLRQGQHRGTVGTGWSGGLVVVVWCLQGSNKQQQQARYPLAKTQTFEKSTPREAIFEGKMGVKNGRGWSENGLCCLPGSISNWAAEQFFDTRNMGH